MTAKRMLGLCAALVVLCLAIGMMPDEVYAQNDSAAANAVDKDRATKKGVRDSLADGRKKSDDEPGPPNKAQMAVGIGSFIVMIIVVKWL